MARANAALSLVDVQKIDEACDRFEADWKAGRRPRIEDYLGTAAGELRAEFLKALLAIELELLAQQGQRPDPASYRARFPSDTDVVDAAVQSTATRGGVKLPVGVSDTSASGRSISTGQFEQAKAPPPPSTSDVPLKQIGRFQVLAVLGEGAFGRVYHAKDPKLDREVAIKVPRKDALTQDEMERFLREAQSAANLHHPNICPVYEVNQEGDRHYLVMAYVPGKSLAAHLKDLKNPLPAKQAALVIRKLALALEAAHAKGVIHRDLKPANIMFDRDRKDVVIMDFGLARRVRKDEAQITQSGQIMGTPAYMPPEQVRGDVKAIGPCSDIYSLGVMLYEMLTGRRPFEGPLAEVLSDALHKEPPPPSSRRSGVDSRLEAIGMKAIAKEPAQRYPSMKAFADALNNYLKGTSTTAPIVSAGPASATAPQVGPETQNFNEILAAFSAERKADRAAFSVALRKARTPWWVWLSASGLLGLILLGGIIFFSRTPTAVIMIHLEGVNLEDKSLAFRLDDKPISAEELSKPVEVKLGDHTLHVLKDGKVVREFKFTIKADDKDIQAQPTPDTLPAPAAPFGPLVFDHSLLKADTLDQLHQAAGWGPAAIVEPGAGLRFGSGNTNSLVWAKAHLGDRYRVQFQARFNEQGFAGWILNGPGYGNLLHTGYWCSCSRTEFWLEREGVWKQQQIKLPKAITAGEWANVQADVDRGKITVTIDGVPLQPFVDPNPLTGPLHGWFGMTDAGNQGGEVVYRNLRIWSAAKDTNRPRQLTPPVGEKPLASGKLLYDLQIAQGNLGPEWWKSHPGNGAVEGGAVVLTAEGSNDPQTLVLNKPLPADVACEIDFEYPTPHAFGLGVMLWFANQAPHACKDGGSAWLATPHGGEVWWHRGPMDAHEFGGFHSKAPAVHFTPYYAPEPRRRYIARIEMFGDTLRIFLDGGLLATAKRPADAAAPAMPVFFGLRQFQTKTKIHALRIYQIAPKLVADPDRRAADVVLSLGGKLRVSAKGAESDVDASDQLPKEAFHVTAIRLDGKKTVDDRTLEQFQGLTKLRELRVTYDPITDQGLKYIKGLTALDTLAIGYTQVTDQGLENLKNLTALRGIALDNTQVGDEGLKHLAGLKELETLWAFDTKVTDEGIGHLKGLTNLRTLRLENTKVTAGGVQKLKAALPNCSIVK